MTVYAVIEVCYCDDVSHKIYVIYPTREQAEKVVKELAKINRCDYDYYVAEATFKEI